MAAEVKKVLLIGDDQDVIRIMQKDLVKASNKMFEVETVGSLSTGLKRIRWGGIDVILLDMSLPGSNGLNTFTKVHEHAPEVPVIVLTNFGDDAFALKVMQKGAQDCLIKGSMDGNMLTRSIIYAVERHRIQSEFQSAQPRKQRSLVGFWKSLNIFLNFQKNGKLDIIHSEGKFRVVIERERSRADRHNHNFSLVVFEVKNEDTDKVTSEHLVKVLFKRRLRPTDEIGWFDKQNIGVLLQGTNAEGARRFSNIIREKIAITHLPPDCSVYTYPSEGLEVLAGIERKT